MKYNLIWGVFIGIATHEMLNDLIEKKRKKKIKYKNGWLVANSMNDPKLMTAIPYWMKSRKQKHK